MQASGLIAKNRHDRLNRFELCRVHARKRWQILAVVVTLLAGLTSLSFPAPADAHRLPYKWAKQHAKQVAKARYREEDDQTRYKLSRGYRQSNHKIVFVWDADYSDDGWCVGYISVRFASRRSYDTVARFSGVDCE